MQRLGGGAIGSGAARYGGGEYLPEGKQPGAEMGVPCRPLLLIILSGEYIILLDWLGRAPGCGGLAWAPGCLLAALSSDARSRYLPRPLASHAAPSKSSTLSQFFLSPSLARLSSGTLTDSRGPGCRQRLGAALAVPTTAPS